MTTTTDAKLIRRNATKQLPLIFATAKTAKVHYRSNGCTAETFTNLSYLEKVYNKNKKAQLYKLSEGEYYLTVDSSEWYFFSTNETQPQPEAKPEPVAIELAPVNEIELSPEVEFVSASEFRPDGTEIELSPDVEFEPAPEQIEAPTIESLQAEIAKLKQQLAQATAPTAPAAPPKAPIQSITLRPSARRSSECGELTVTDWRQADIILKQWARTAPATGGAHKCDITLIFEDKESFKTGVQLQRSHSFTFNLAKEVLDALSFMAGENPCSQYQRWLSKHPSHQPATYKKLLSQWLIPA